MTGSHTFGSLIKAYGHAKDIDGVSAATTLEALADIVRYEFAVERTAPLHFTLGERRLHVADTARTLGELGVRDDSVLSFALALEEIAFDVRVADMAGDEVLIEGLTPDLRLAQLVDMVEEAMEVVGDESVSLISGAQPLRDSDSAKTLGALGISANAQLMALKQLKIKNVCPKCSRGSSTMHDVTIGSTHEGWGGRWNKCNYSCQHCNTQIANCSKVNACSRCRCFWHRSCKMARVSNL